MQRLLIWFVLLTVPLFGEDSIRGTHHIHGGGRIPSASFRNVAYIDQYSGFCTGTLVHWNWVLTAGHCVSRDNRTRINPINRITFGREEPYRDDIYDIGRIIVHPQYSAAGKGFAYDYALIELPGGAPDGITPVSVMTLSQERDFFSRIERKGIIIGHGRGGASRLALNYAEVPAQTHEECVQQQGADPEIAHSDTVCANSSNQYIGSGDSGGPLLILPPSDLSNGSSPFDDDRSPNQSFDNYSQLGVASIRSYDRDGEHRASVFARTSIVYDWIQRTTASYQILPHVFSGDLNGLNTWTEVVFTNTTLEPCPIVLLFSQGTQSTSPIQFDGKVYDRNRISFNLSAGTTRSVQMTSLDDSFTHGTLYVDPSCPSTAINTQGRYVIQDRQGSPREVFSIAPEISPDWLSQDRCKILTSKFGNGRDVGLAFVTAQPDQVAPSGSQLTFNAYTWDGNPAETLAPITITGLKTALNPWDLDEPRMIEICLDTGGSSEDFRLAILAVGAKAVGGKVQYFTEDLIDP